MPANRLAGADASASAPRRRPGSTSTMPKCSTSSRRPSPATDGCCASATSSPTPTRSARRWRSRSPSAAPAATRCVSFDPGAAGVRDAAEPGLPARRAAAALPSEPAPASRRPAAVITFDTGTAERLGRARALSPCRATDGPPVLVIDHHARGTAFGSMRLVDADGRRDGRTDRRADRRARRPLRRGRSPPACTPGSPATPARSATPRRAPARTGSPPGCSRRAPGTTRSACCCGTPVRPATCRCCPVR